MKTKITPERRNDVVLSAPVPSDAQIPNRYRVLGAKQLLEELFEPPRPSLRWIRSLTEGRRIPFMKLGGRVFFDPAEVRRHLEQNTFIPR